MSKKKGRLACDGWRLKAKISLDAHISATPSQTQISYLIARFGLEPQRAAVVAVHAFGEGVQ
jgi:hypothetical protein